MTVSRYDTTGSDFYAKEKTKTVMCVLLTGDQKKEFCGFKDKLLEILTIPDQSSVYPVHVSCLCVCTTHGVVYY